MKLCKDCVHFRPDNDCLKQAIFDPDCVNGGKPEVRFDWRTSCTIQRRHGFIARLFNNTCGRGARWFQPKNP